MSRKEKNELPETPVEETAGAEKTKKSRNFKKLKFGSMSVVVIVLVIAIVIVLNLMCGLLMKRYPIKLDLTPDNRYELSEKSIEAVKAIDKDVEITVMMTKDYFSAMSQQYESMFYQYYHAVVDMPFEIIPEILDKYSVYAEQGKGSITVKYVDMNKDPDVVTRFSNYYSGEITQGSIVLQCGERVKVIDSNAVAGMIAPTENSTVDSINMTFAGESTITSAIRAVTDANPVKTAFVTTMNGNSVLDNAHSSIVASFENFLSTNGYECLEIDIATDALSVDDYDMLVVACPAVDFTEDIITKISDFLYNSGKYEKDLIYVPNLNATNLPNISAFLEDWKIEIQQSVVMDENMVQATFSSLGTVSYAPMLQIADTETVGTLPNDVLPIIASYAKPINIVSKNNDGITKEILKSSETSYLADLATGEASTEKGAYNVVVSARRETAEQLNVYGSDVLVIGSPFMLDSAVLGSTNTYNNASAVLNIVNNISGKEATEIIPEKALNQTGLAITTASAGVIQIVVIIVIPLLIAIAGAVVLIWRKNK